MKNKKLKRITQKELRKKYRFLNKIILFNIIIILISISVLFFNFNNEEEIKVNSQTIPDYDIKTIFAYPNENMIDHSRADIYLRVILPIPIKKAIERQFSDELPNETLFCLGGYVRNNIYYIDELRKGNITFQSKNSITGNCHKNTIIYMHSHPNTSSYECSPSDPDLRFNDYGLVEGLVCGINQTEKIMFYDSYRHYLNLLETDEDKETYGGFIDSNPFQAVAYSAYIKGEEIYLE